jgi:hypothetical protein
MMDLGHLLAAHLNVVFGGHQVLPDVRHLLARLISHGQMLAETQVAADVESRRARGVVDNEMLGQGPLASDLVAHI